MRGVSFGARQAAVGTMLNKRTAVYPGTFDPITNGHHDLERSEASIFDKVVVAIAANPNKAPMFTLEQRVDMARAPLRRMCTTSRCGATWASPSTLRVRTGCR